MIGHPLLDQLDASLHEIVRGEAVECRGEWTTASRRSYQSSAQAGSGSGPFVDVMDVRWRGGLTSASPVSGIAFLATDDALYWAKAAQASTALPVDVSFHAARGCPPPERAMFTANLAGAYLPGVPVAGTTNLMGSCALGPDLLTTGRVICLAQVSSAAFFVLLFPRDALKFGRKRLWRVRDELAATLPDPLGQLLTRRRTGMERLATP